MPHRELAGREKLLHAVGQLEQPQEVRHRRPLLADTLRDLLLRQSELFVELVIGVRLFDRVQVLTLDVLDERDLERVPFAHHLLHDDGNRGQSSLQRGAEAALAGDELVAVARARDDERLHDPVLADAAGEVFEGCLVEGAPRLVGIGRDLVEGDLHQARRRLRGSRRNERAEAAAEDFLLVHQITFSARWMNSLARLT